MKEIQIAASQTKMVSVAGEIISVPSVSCQELIEAFKGPRIAALASYEVGNKLKDALTKAYYHLGYKLPDIEEFLKLQIYLSDFLTTEKVYLPVTMDEIAIAIKRGSDRQYGEFFGINPATVTGWIRAYMASESRKDAKVLALQLDAAKDIPKANPTPQEQWDMFVERLKILYKNYLLGITIQPSEATFVFKILHRSKVIKFDEARRNKLKSKALEQIQKEKDPANATTLDEKRKMNVVFDHLLEKGIEDTHVISRAMALGLIEWFEDLKQFGTTIEEAVNEEF